MKLWAKVRHLRPVFVCTDDYAVYESFISQDNHYTGKDGTQDIESLNFRIRHFLARFRQKSKCYFKALCIVIAFLALFFFENLLSTS